MKDKIAFENSVREKSSALIRERKKRHKAMLYTASSLCMCFVIAFGVFLSAPMTKKAFDAAAPESANDVYYDDRYYSADADYSKGNGGQNSATEKESHDILPAYTQALPSQPKDPVVTAKPSVPTTAGDIPTTEVPVTTAPIYPEQDKSSPKYLKRYATSVSISTSEIAKLTKSREEIELIIDIIFSGEEIKTAPDGEYTVKVLVKTPSEEQIFFLTESDAADIIP